MCQVDIGVITFHDLPGKIGDPWPVSPDIPERWILCIILIMYRTSVPGMSAVILTGSGNGQLTTRLHMIISRVHALRFST
jgi:hypothetical protein